MKKYLLKFLLTYLIPKLTSNFVVSRPLLPLSAEKREELITKLNAMAAYEQNLVQMFPEMTDIQKSFYQGTARGILLTIHIVETY